MVFLMNTKPTVMVGILVVFIIAVLAWRVNTPVQLPASINPSTSTSTEAATSDTLNMNDYTRDYAGTISTSTDGQFIYASNKIGLTFTFPTGWHLQDDALGPNGGLQIFNAIATEATGVKGIPIGGDKIGVGISNSTSYDDTGDYPEISQTTTNIRVSGQSVIREDIELVTVGKIRTYYIPWPSHSGEFLSMTIFGDPSNFHIWDEIVQSIKWK